MTDVTKRTTLLDSSPINNFVTYVKTQTSDIVFPERGISEASLVTNGSKESWTYKSQVVQHAISAQNTHSITFDATSDSAILALMNGDPGYVWNVTQNEVISIRSANTTSGVVEANRGLFGTSVGTWAVSDVLKFLNIITLSAYTAMVKGVWTATITTNPAADEVLTITYGGVTKTYTAVASDPTDGEFVPGADIEATAAVLAPMIEADYASTLTSVVESATGFVVTGGSDYTKELTVCEFAEGDTGVIAFVETTEPAAAVGIGGRGTGMYLALPDFGVGQSLITP